MVMAMAAGATDSALAGDAADMLLRGIIGRVNKLAVTCGVILCQNKKPPYRN